MPPIPDRLPPIAPDQVCVVVVTYNRKDLLRECLQALLAQTCPLACILVVNNTSTDGTLEMLAGEFPATRFPQVEVLDLPKNIGGAGGFHEGMKHADAQKRYHWVRLMDDDTSAEPGALGELLLARSRFPAGHQPMLLASKVVWTDGTLHPMNSPWVNQNNSELFYLAIERGAVTLRTATFVSVLIHRQLVEQYGLPIADYFIWGDDVEYSGRVLRENMGVLVTASRVCHKTVKKYSTVDGSSQRFYYHVRNSLWMLARSPAWTSKERLRLSYGFLRSLITYVGRSRGSWASFQAIGRGIRDAASTRPQR